MLVFFGRNYIMGIKNLNIFEKNGNNNIKNYIIYIFFDKNFLFYRDIIWKQKKRLINIFYIILEVRPFKK